MGTPPATSQIADDPGPGDPSPAKASPTQLKIDELIQNAKEIEGARVGVWAAPLGSKEPLVDLRSSASFNSASNTKIVTAVAALALLGPNFRFSTGLWGSGFSLDGSAVKTLHLVGGGDPSLGIDHIVGMAQDMRTSGITRVERVAIDDSYFDDEDLPPHYDEQPKEQSAFRAPINAAGLGFNSFAIHVIPNPSGSGAARVVIDPPVDYIDVKTNAVTTVPRGRARLRVDTRARRGRLVVDVQGQVRAGSTRRVRRRVPDPNAFAASVVRWALKGAGIKVATRVYRETDVPKSARLIAERRSAPLAVLVRGLGKYSNNYMAETILKAIAAETNEDAPGSWKVALEAVRAFVTEKVGLEAGSFVYENGSGLFESNKFTPRQIARILEWAANDPRIGPEFFASLAVAGTDGTLRARMEQGPVTGVLRAKTGTLATVSTLSGTISRQSKPPIVFSILINEIPKGKVAFARELQDAIATALIE